MGTRLATPHDNFFRALMGYPRAVNALFREHLPRELVAELADEPPRLVDGTFIDGRLKELLSDRLFELKTRRSGHLYGLLEHKSAPERWVALQLSQYLVGVVVDVGAIDDASLSSDPTLKAGLMLLKYATRDAQSQRSRLGAVLESLKAAPWLLEMGMTYMLATYKHIDRTMLLAEVRRIMPENEEEMLSIAAKEWRAEWQAEALAKGLAEGLAEGRAAGRAEALLHILGRRFGPLPSEACDRVRTASPDAVDRWLDLALDATSLEGVFGPSH